MRIARRLNYGESDNGRYINGAFSPDEEVELEDGARVSLTYLIERGGVLAAADDALKAAEALLDQVKGAFGEDGLDKARLASNMGRSVDKRQEDRASAAGSARRMRMAAP